jgi:hypothetical protein
MFWQYFIIFTSVSLRGGNVSSKMMHDGNIVKVYLKCAICGNLLPEHEGTCKYCGAFINYDEDKGLLYVSGRTCFKCGGDNKPQNSACEKCGSEMNVKCAQCGAETGRHDVNCRACGLRLDENYMADEVHRRLTDTRKTKSSISGLYFLFYAVMLCLIALGYYIYINRHVDFQRIILLSMLFVAGMSCLGAIALYIKSEKKKMES